MSNMVERARRELEILGAPEEDIQKVLPVIQAFANAGHSGGSAPWHISIIHNLLNQLPLSPLTTDESEWDWVDEVMLWADAAPLWQNNRDSRAMSNDGGKTYYLVTEVKGDYRKYYFSEESNGHPRRNNGEDRMGTH